MGDKTKIAWCHKTFNPWEGCTRVSAECDKCYAEARDVRWHAGAHWGPGGSRKPMAEAYWRKPLRWDSEARNAGFPVRVFCGSLCDVFEDRHTSIPDFNLNATRMRLFDLIKQTPHLIWMLLTKRADFMVEWFKAWPELLYPNIWPGVTAGTQASADQRIPLLLQVNARVRFVSMEPLLEVVDLKPEWMPGLSWVIVGGESGREYRPLVIDNVRSVYEQCWRGGVPFFCKQDSSVQPGCRGRIPDDLWIRQFPVDTSARKG